MPKVKFKIKLILWFYLTVPVLSIVLFPPFLNPQEKYPRVQKAKRENDLRLKQLFRNKELTYPPRRVYIRALKKEKQLELWVWSGNQSYTLFKSYAFCSSSGVLGPKRQQGDLQIPEGFFIILIVSIPGAGFTSPWVSIIPIVPTGYRVTNKIPVETYSFMVPVSPLAVFPLPMKKSKSCTGFAFKPGITDNIIYRFIFSRPGWMILI